MEMIPRRRILNGVNGKGGKKFVIAMGALCDSVPRNMAERLNVSAYPLDPHIPCAMGKLNMENRDPLKQYMLL